MYRFKKRLDALEQAEHSGPRFPAFTAGLMIAYATPKEHAEWEAAGRPEFDRMTWKQALDAAYSGLAPGCESE
jgi:hypothetical protein